MKTKLCVAWNGGDETSLDCLWLKRPFFGDGTCQTMQAVIADRKQKVMADERWLKHQLGQKGSVAPIKVLQGPREGFWNAWYSCVHEGLCGIPEQKGYMCVNCGPLLSLENCKCASENKPNEVVLWPKHERNIPVGLVPYHEFLSKPEILETGLPMSLIQVAGGQSIESATGVRLTIRHVLEWASRTGIQAYMNATKAKAASKSNTQILEQKKRNRRNSQSNLD
jgi:hypothetical protein